MDPIHKKILRERSKELIDTIILTSGFMAELIQTGLFDEDMIQLIQAENTRGDKVSKLLEILLTRGPTAFNTFVKLLERNHSWLYNDLQDDIRQEIARQKTNKDQEEETITPNAQESLSTSLHKKFGQSRSLSEREKKDMQSFVEAISNLEQDFEKLKEKNDILIEERNECLTVLTSTTDTTLERCDTCLSFIGVEHVSLLKEINKVQNNHELEIKNLGDETKAIVAQHVLEKEALKKENEELKDQNTSSMTKSLEQQVHLLRSIVKPDPKQAMNLAAAVVGMAAVPSISNVLPPNV